MFQGWHEEFDRWLQVISLSFIVSPALQIDVSSEFLPSVLMKYGEEVIFKFWLQAYTLLSKLNLELVTEIDIRRMSAMKFVLIYLLFFG